MLDIAGTGRDTLSAGVGDDTGNTAFGADTVSGRDAINAATAGPAARISGGAGRDIARVNRNERRRIHGVEVVHFVRRPAGSGRRAYGPR